MNYHLLTGEQLGEELTFLPGEIRENIRNGRGWLMVGEEEKTDKIGTDEKTEAEEGRILTMAAFQLKPEERGCVELAYIYTVPEAREEGCAMGLLYEAERILGNSGVQKILCMPMGEREEIVDFTHFLLLAGFEPVILDGHICTYDRTKLLESKALQPFYTVNAKIYTHLDRAEMRYYAREQGKELPRRFRDELLGDCDTKKSVFAIENGRMRGAILLGNPEKEKERAELLNVYVDPEWKQKQQILAMLVQVVRELREDTKGIDIAIDDERVRKLLTYVLGEAEKDYWVQRYEKTITPEEAEEAFDDE